MSTTLTIADGPKMLREALCVAEHAVNRNVEPQNQHGAPRILAALIAECDRHRPLGPDGKHGDRHTDTCGCDDVPLDPSKVKAGDTVTLERDGGRLPDQSVRALSTGAVGRLALVLAGGIAVVVEGPDAWTLTDHQLAPEPESEYEVGVTIADISIRGCHAAPLTTLRGLRRDGGWRTAGGNWDDVNVESVSPLVVIDPAAVDVDALAEAYLRSVEGAPGARGRPSLRTKDGIRAVLAELGIEAAS